MDAGPSCWYAERKEEKSDSPWGMFSVARSWVQVDYGTPGVRIRSQRSKLQERTIQANFENCCHPSYIGASKEKERTMIPSVLKGEKRPRDGAKTGGPALARTDGHDAAKARTHHGLPRAGKRQTRGPRVHAGGLTFLSTLRGVQSAEPTPGSFLLLLPRDASPFDTFGWWPMRFGEKNLAAQRCSNLLFQVHWRLILTNAPVVVARSQRSQRVGVLTRSTPDGTISFAVVSGVAIKHAG